MSPFPGNEYGRTTTFYHCIKDTKRWCLKPTKSGNTDKSLFESTPDFSPGLFPGSVCLRTANGKSLYCFISWSYESNERLSLDRASSCCLGKLQTTVLINHITSTKRHHLTISTLRFEWSAALAFFVPGRIQLQIFASRLTSCRPCWCAPAVWFTPSLWTISS